MSRSASVILFVLAACSGASPEGQPSFKGIATITLRGYASLSDGSPAARRTLQMRFLGNGEDLFPAGVRHCTEGDDHAQALQVVNVVTALDGSFFVSAPIDGFVRATDEKCSMSRRAAARMHAVDVKVQSDVDVPSCFAYCRSQRDYDACMSNCVALGQKFVWSTSLTSRDVGSHIDVPLTSLGPPIEPIAPQADLQVDGKAAAESIVVDHQDFAADSCEIEDQCIAAPGHRTLIRFDGVVQNLGGGDLYLGSPAKSPYFTFSQCHQHYHLMDFLRAELVDPDTGLVVTRADGQVVSQKQGFCIEDVDQVAGNTPGKYDCQNQGLTSGWSDVYTNELNCQWIDVTDVKPGKYTLRLTVNAGGTLPEADTSNNSALIPVVVPQE